MTAPSPRRASQPVPPNKAAASPAEPPVSAAAAADAECIQAVLAGQRERFGELVGRYQRVVYGVVFPYVREPHRAEDLAQEVFVNAFSALAQLREQARFLPWLLQIARHRASREARRQSARPESALHPEMDVPEPEPNPDRARAADVLAMVEELPEPYRQTMLQKYQQGLSCKQIAQAEGVPIGTITSRLTRALAVLRNAIGKGERP
ncbi:MAG: sigma-70 family RNA polymerase sigma factor [Planctomycetes bacterium]|nr:sigma-70 family RNA polymerase sigma factor [Planctomycetota bacterium]